MEKSVARAVAVQAVGAGFNAAAGFLLMAYLARRMGAVAFGDYVAVLSVAVIVLLLIEGGWPTLAYRETAGGNRDASRGIGARGLGHVVLATFVAVGIALAATLAGAPRALPAAFACMGVVAAMNLVSASLRGQGRFGTDAAWQAIGRTVSAVAIVAAVVLAGPSASVVFVAWGAGLLACLACVAGRWWTGPRLPAWASYAAVLPLAGIDALAAALFRADVAVLQWSGASGLALAEYAASTRFNEAALLLFAPVANVALRTTRVRAGTPSALRSFLAWALSAAAVAGLAAWAVCSAAAVPLLALVFGPGYETAAPLMAWTSGALPFSLPALVAVQGLLALGENRWLLATLGAGVLALAAAVATGHAWGGTLGAAMGLAGAHAAILAMLLAGLAQATRSRRVRP